MQEVIEKKIDKVINKLINLEDIDSKQFENLSQSEKERIGYFARDFGMDHWDWPQGIGLFGLSNTLHDFDDYIINWANNEISKGLPCPNVNTVCPLLTLMDYQEYENLVIDWGNKIYKEFARTQEGGIQHNTTGATKEELVTNKEQIWVDTIFMTTLFLGKAGVKYGKEEWIRESIYQVLVHTKYLLDRKTNLFYHGWDFSKRSNFGSIFWCRGNSWLTMALPIFINIMEAYLTFEEKEYLLNLYRNQVESLFMLRDAKSHLWHTILDDEGSYIETSGSAGILAGVYQGLIHGYIDEKYRLLAEESLNAFIEYIDDSGTLSGVSAGTAISSSKEDYKKIIVKPMAYGQALSIYALSLFSKYSSSEKYS